LNHATVTVQATDRHSTYCCGCIIRIGIWRSYLDEAASINIQHISTETLQPYVDASAASAAAALAYKNAAEVAEDNSSASAADAAASAAAAAGIVVGEVNAGNTNAVLKTSSTGSMAVPAGTTAQRDVAPVYGAQRANSTLNIQEWWNGTAWVAMGGGATGGQGNTVFHENDQHVTADYTIPVGKNAVTAGPIIIDDGATVTISNGCSWTIVGGN